MFSGSINLTDLKNDWEVFDNPEIMPRFGYSAGFGLEFSIKKSFFLRSQIIFVAKNYAFNTEDFYGAGTKGYDRYSALYLDLPIMAGYRYKDFHIVIGPFIDYFLGGTNQHKLEYFNGQVSSGNIDIKSAQALREQIQENEIFPLKSHYLFDAGIVFGIGYHNKNYSLDLNHSFGMVNIFPSGQMDCFRDDFSLYSRVFTLQLNVFL